MIILPSVSRFAQRLLLALSLIVYILLAVFSAYWLGEITRHKFGADFTIYYQAFQDAQAGGNPYEPYDIGASFVNHPFVLTLVSLLDWTNQPGIALGLWIGLSVLAWVGVLYILLLLLQISGRPLLFHGHGLTIWLLLWLGYGPFWETIQIGQINIFVFLFILLALFFSEKDKPHLAGCFLALSIVFKTSPLLLSIYFLLRGQWRVLLWAGIFTGIVTLVAAIQFSPTIIANYLKVVTQVGGEIHPTLYNQSFLSLAYRGRDRLGLGDVAEIFILGHKILLGSLLIITSVIGYQKLHTTSFKRIWWFSLYLSIMVIFSPLVWYHHSVYLLLPLALIFASPSLSWVGILCVFLLQAERAFDWFVWPVALPVLSGHMILLIVMLGMALISGYQFSERKHVSNL